MFDFNRLSEEEKTCVGDPENPKQQLEPPKKTTLNTAPQKGPAKGMMVSPMYMHFMLIFMSAQLFNIIQLYILFNIASFFGFRSSASSSCMIQPCPPEGVATRPVPLDFSPQ